VGHEGRLPQQLLVASPRSVTGAPPAEPGGA
jgi:hypothetical protein